MKKEKKRAELLTLRAPQETWNLELILRWPLFGSFDLDFLSGHHSLPDKGRRRCGSSLGLCLRFTRGLIRPRSGADNLRGLLGVLAQPRGDENDLDVIHQRLVDPVPGDDI